MKACDKCGAGNSDAARFCNACGAPFPLNPSASPVETPSRNESASVWRKLTKGMIPALAILIVLVIFAALRPRLGMSGAENSGPQDDASADTVAGRLDVIYPNPDDRMVFEIRLDGRTAEKGDGAYVSFKKTFQIGGKTVVFIESASGGTACPATYYFKTISKNGEMTDSNSVGNCSDLYDLSQNGDEISVSFPTLKQNMQGTETWIYREGKITTTSNVKDTFPQDKNSLSRVRADTQVTLSGEVILDETATNAEGYFKLTAPIVIDDKFEWVDSKGLKREGFNPHDGEIGDRFLMGSQEEMKRLNFPEVGAKGWFKVVITCPNSGCVISEIEPSQAP